MILIVTNNRTQTHLYMRVFIILLLLIGGVSSEVTYFKEMSGILCRNGTVCSFAEFRNRIKLTCPSSILKFNGTKCRNARGLCNIPEYCHQINITCPIDISLPDGAVCRINNNLRRYDGTGPICLILNFERNSGFAMTSELLSDLAYSTVNPKRGSAYSIKCGKRVYFYGMETLNEIIFKKNKVLIFVGTSVGPVSSVFIFDWPECLQSCIPLEYPNGKKGK
jgi:hypothetical protein